MARRPLVAVPARFSRSASALRYRALVTARALSQAVLDAGAEPLTVHPRASQGDVAVADVGQRLAFADAVLLPGGGDLDPMRYGRQHESEHVYDVDAEQDGFDLAVARWAWETGRPLLAVCRGMHVVAVLHGGALDQHFEPVHRHVVQRVGVAEGTLLHRIAGREVTASCYHHQRLDGVPRPLRAVAWSADGTVEAVERAEPGGWFLGVQWHPEDTVSSDDAQRALFSAWIAAAR